jgi:hypothetical protein
MSQSTVRITATTPLSVVRVYYVLRIIALLPNASHLLTACWKNIAASFFSVFLVVYRTQIALLETYVMKDLALPKVAEIQSLTAPLVSTVILRLSPVMPIPLIIVEYATLIPGKARFLAESVLYTVTMKQITAIGMIGHKLALVAAHRRPVSRCIS